MSSSSGITELKPREPAMETNELCVRIFNAVGTSTTSRDIDIPHLIGLHRQTRYRRALKTIICRLACEDIIMMRQEIRNLLTKDSVLPEKSVLIINAGIYGHLAPKCQQLLNDALKFKDCHNCWTKNSVIWLGQQADFRPVRIKDMSDQEQRID